MHDILADGVQEMRFAQANPSVNKKRVVRFPGRLRDGQSGGVREIVVTADDEIIEGVLGIEVVNFLWIPVTAAAPLVVFTAGLFAAFLGRIGGGGGGVRGGGGGGGLA